jgi:hypothetical protein
MGSVYLSMEHTQSLVSWFRKCRPLLRRESPRPAFSLTPGEVSRFPRFAQPLYISTLAFLDISLLRVPLLISFPGNSTSAIFLFLPHCPPFSFPHTTPQSDPAYRLSAGTSHSSPCSAFVGADEGAVVVILDLENPRVEALMIW